MAQQNQFGQTLGVIVENWQGVQEPPRTKMAGQYCVLEPLNVDLHAQILFDAFQFNNLGDTWTYLPFGPFNTIADFKTWLDTSNKTKVVFTIVDSRTNKAEGIATYHDIDLAHGSIEVGSIHYSKQLQKTRAATEAMYLMMNRVFEELGYRRYQWRCNALNQGSRRAAERLGFKFEGIFRQQYVFKDRNRDTAWFSIIDSEWPALKTKFNKWLNPTNFDSTGCQILKLEDC